MKKLSILLSLTTLFVGACTKNKTDTLNVKNGVIHSWELYQQGSDLNQNDKMDNTEANIVEETERYTLQLKGDNSGFKVGYNNTTVDSLTWSFNDNETYIIIKLNSAGFISTKAYKFDFGTDFLLLKDTSVSPIYFTYYKRKD